MLIKFSEYSLNEAAILEGKNSALNLKKILRLALTNVHDGGVDDEEFADLKKAFPKIAGRIAKIEDSLSDLSNDYSDLEDMHDEEPGYYKFEKACEKAYERIEKLIEALPDLIESEDSIKIRHKGKETERVEALKVQHKKYLDEAAAFTAKAAEIAAEIKKAEKKLAK